MRRASTAIASLALAALAILVVGPRLDRAASLAVSSGIARLKSAVEGAIGLTVSFDSLSPSILRSASVSGLAISAPGGRTLLAARRVRISYDLMALIRGEGSKVLTGLELSGVELDLRLPEDAGLLGRLASPSTGSGAAGLAGLPRLRLEGRDVSVRVSVSGEGVASLDARSVSLSTSGEEHSLSLDGSFAVDSGRLGLGTIEGPLSVSGSFARDLSRARLDLAVAAESRVATLSTQRLQIVYGDRALTVTKVKDRAPLDAALRIDLAGGESSASIKLDGYAPSSLIKLRDRFAFLEPWLDMAYTGSANASLRGADFSKLEYGCELSGSLPPSLLGEGPPARAEIAAKGDLAKVAIEKALFERGGDRVAYSGSLAFADLSPDGELDLDLALAGGRLPVSSKLRLAGHGGEYIVMADLAELGGAAVRDLSLLASRKGELVDFSLSFRPPEPEPDPGAPAEEAAPASFSGEAGATSGLPLVKCEGSASFGAAEGGATPSLELSVDLESVDLAPWKSLVAALADSPGLGEALARIKLGGAVFATSDFKRVSWSAPDLTIVSRSLPGAYALLSLSGASATISVKRALVSAFGLQVEGSGSADLASSGGPSFQASLSIGDIPYSVKGRVGDGALRLEGDYGLEVGARSEAEGTSFSAKAKALPIPLLGGLFLATGSLSGRYASIEDWALAVGDLELDATGERFAALPALGLSGSFGPRGAELPSLRVSDKVSALTGSASISYDLSGPFSAKASARLASASGSKAGLESYAIAAAYAGGKIEGTVDLVAAPLSRLGKLPIEGSVDGRASVSGPLSDPSFAFSLRLRDGRYDGQTLALAASGGYSGGALDLGEVSAAYQGYSLSGARARFSFADASASASFVLAGSMADEAFRCSVSAEGKSTAAGGPKEGLGAMLADYEAKGSLREFSFGSTSISDWPFAARIGGDAVSLDLGASHEVRLKYSKGGALSASLRSPFPVTADVSGLYDGKNIDLSIQGIDFDLGLFSSLIPADIVQIRAGRARGGFRAIGLASDPDISGEIDMTGARVKVPGWLADDIGPFDSAMVALGRKVSARAEAVPAGKGSVVLDFQATFDHWLPANLVASAATSPGSTVSVDSTILGIRAKGVAAVDVRFALRGDVLSIGADVALQKASVVVSPETLATAPGDQGSRSLYLDVSTNVRFGRAAQVMFPSSAFPVVSGYSDPSSSLAIRYNEASGDFSLKGTLSLRGGEVFYIQRNFFLRDGKIVFNEGKDRFDPRVTLLAELRDRNDDGPVVITLRADNAPIASFKPRLSSDPPMTEAQIASLMGQNLFGATADSSLDIRKAVISGSELIPQLNVARAFENTAREFLGVDILSMRTLVLQKWLVDFTGQSQAAEAAPLGRYFDQTEIYLGKYLSDSVFAHASMSLHEAPLAAVYPLTLDSELGVELDTPFGIVQWNVTPKHFENLLVNDQSLSLIWKFSL
jgi:translocation and assembly module TamB